MQWCPNWSRCARDKTLIPSPTHSASIVLLRHVHPPAPLTRGGRSALSIVASLLDHITCR
jgi:hypothetical protein